MRQIGDYVVYRKEVCQIVGMKENHFKGKDYYVLVPISDASLKIDVPVDHQLGYLRDLISKEEAMKIIERIPDVEAIHCDEKLMETQYKLLLNNGSHENLIQIIKTAYLRNKERVDNKKKISDKDHHYFELAEKYLYTEIGIALGMSYEEAKDYIVDRVRKATEI